MAVPYLTPSDSYSEHHQLRDLRYLEQLPASQKPDPVVVNRLMAHDLIHGISYSMQGEALVCLTPRGGALMLKAKS